MKTNKLVVHLISVFVCIFPFITLLHIEKLTGIDYYVYPSQNGYIADYFLYYKEVFLILFSLVLICFLIYDLLFNENTKLKTKQFVSVLPFIIIYIILIVLSSINSSNKNVVLMGSYTEYEGVLALISYIILMISSYNFIDDYNNYIFKRAIIILSFIIGLLSIIEFFYKPLLMIDFINSKLRLNELIIMDSKVALTIYNSNYLGGICSLLLPSNIILYLKNEGVKKYLYFSSSCLIYFSLIVSGSNASIYSSIIIFSILVLSNLKKIKQYFFKVLIIASIFIILPIILLFNNKFRSQINKHFKKNTVNNSFNIDNISTTDEKIILTSTDKFIEFEKNNGDIVINYNDEKLLINEKNKDYNLNNYIFNYDGEILTCELGYQNALYLYFKGKPGIIVNKKVITNFKKYNNNLYPIYSFATGRGYIWINSIEILKNTILIGKGPGNFIYNYDQTDVVGLLKVHNNSNVIIDKPHNWYLQIIISTGFISFICISIIFIKIISKNIIQKNKNHFDYGILIGICTFLVVGVFNDSIISVNPVFWILIGYLLKNQ